MSDKLSVESLCRTEFGFTPHIVRCRRLGQVRVDQIQPVLVMLQSATDAEFFINNAKSLRESSNPRVKRSVYINADLTKAEAQIAYRERSRRRALTAARNSTRVNSGTRVAAVYQMLIIYHLCLQQNLIQNHQLQR